jgi:hypothetical protein
MERRGATIHFAAEASGAGEVRLYVNVGPDLAALEATHRASGVEISSPLGLKPWGQREFVRDRDGNLLRVGTPG